MLRGHFRSDLVRDVDGRVLGIHSAGVGVDDDVVFTASARPQAFQPVDGEYCRVQTVLRTPLVLDRRHGPPRPGLDVGVSGARRPLLPGGGEEVAGLSGGGEQDHCLLDEMSQVIALLAAERLLGSAMKPLLA